jgi:microcystin degradation protein MlrC
VKGSIHFVNGFAALAKRIVFCASPGSVSLDASLFDYRHIRRPLYPLDKGFIPVAQAMDLDVE